MNDSKYFLPYQIRKIQDDRQIQVWEKSRRIGATYAQAYEDVRDVIKKNIDVWFSSADESAGREYIIYCEKWARLLHAIAQNLGEVVIDSDKNIKAFVIEFANGNRISALSSNPRRFRSKGGKVVLDEFAWHDDQPAMWDAAEPATTWGFPIRIISTHNGKNSLFFKFIEDIKKGKRNWSLHTTPLQLALDEGLLNKIFKRQVSDQEKEDWLKDKRAKCRDENQWLQEYCCVAVDETTALLTYELISACEQQKLLSDNISGDLYVGMDIARKGHLSVIWGVEKLGNVYYTRIYKVLHKAPFRVQREALFDILSHPNMRRACIDATGLGMQLAEEAQEKFGKYRVEGVTFTPSVKEQLAMGLLPLFEDKQIYIEATNEIREDLHSIRKVVTASGNIRFDSMQEETDGHSDRFWALALAIHAGTSKLAQPYNIASRHKRESNSLLRGYE